MSNHSLLITAYEGKIILGRSLIKDTFSHYHYQTTLIQDYVMVEVIGRYNSSSLRFCCRNPLPLDQDLHPTNPIMLRSSPNIGKIFGLDFKGCDLQLMLGYMNKHADPYFTTFTPADTVEAALAAPHVLLRISWNATCPNPYTKKTDLVGVVFSDTVTSNTGKKGTDWWILPFSIAKCQPDQIQELKQACAQDLTTEAENAARLQRLVDSLGM